MPPAQTILRETAKMASELSVFQFEEIDLVQITDGRDPHTLPGDRPGWKIAP